MDISLYDISTQNLIKEIHATGQSPESDILSLLKKLELRAEILSDNTLLGYVYYSYAIYYSYLEKHKEFMDNIKTCISYLLRSGDNELLARGYNLFAAEAQKHGCFEVAYSYYELARSLFEEDNGSFVQAIIEANIGDLLTIMGDHKRGIKHMKRSLSMINKNKNDLMYNQNVAMININIAMGYVADKDYINAKKMYEKIERNTKMIPNAGEMAELWYLIFKLRLAIHDKKKKEIKKLYEVVKDIIIKTDLYNEFTRETYDLCEELIDTKNIELAKELIGLIDKKGKGDSLYYLLAKFENVKAKYFTVTNNKKELIKAYERYDEYLRNQSKVMNSIYYESISIMNLLNELREEEMKIRQDNLYLQKEAETDALTNLPNRYALNKNLEDKFMIALNNGHKFGVGIADIDEFKKYNDTYGHPVGDKCLISVGENLKKIAQDHNLFLARYGGDEFVFIYENLSDQEILKIEQRINKCHVAKISHGFYNEMPNEFTKVWDYFVEADKRLYQKKEAKKRLK